MGERFFAPTGAPEGVAEGIVGDIFSNAVHFRFIANNVFSVVPLPDLKNRGVFPHPFGDPDFKPSNGGTKGFGFSVRPLSSIWFPNRRAAL